jgi:hypothetical protein
MGKISKLLKFIFGRETSPEERFSGSDLAAYRIGFESGESACPFPPGSSLHEAWKAGQRDAVRHEMQKY